MKKGYKTALFIALGIVALVAIYLIVVIIVAMVTKYKPEDIEDIAISSGVAEGGKIVVGEELNIITFNTGYAGLDYTQDFFMDGGKNSGAGSLAEVEANVAGITAFLNENDADFYILQEVDESGKRSYNVNQKILYEDRGMWSNFGYNYKVKYLPIPVFNPMGGAESGLQTLSKEQPFSAERYTFDGKPSYIVSLFELDRCFTVSRFNTDNGKELVMINAHLSAFDKGGTIREQQLAHMKRFLESENEKGNYIILGGDFNHELPGTSIYDFVPEDQEYPGWAQIMPADFTPAGFNWGVDESSPTVRTNNIPLIAGENGLLVIDGFLVSDNIEIVSVKGHTEMEFVFSDHNPVEMAFKLIDEEEES